MLKTTEPGQVPGMGAGGGRDIVGERDHMVHGFYTTINSGKRKF